MELANYLYKVKRNTHTYTRKRMNARTHTCVSIPLSTSLIVCTSSQLFSDIRFNIIVHT